MPVINLYRKEIELGPLKPVIPFLSSIILDLFFQSKIASVYDTI